MFKQVFLFAEFRFDSETGTLTRKNRAVHLPEQAAILLEALLKNANHLVSREELRQVLWPDEEFLDYAQGINVAVNRLRHTLRDNPRNPRFLKTIPKRGYVFCCEVKVVPQDAVGQSRSPDAAAVPTAPEDELTVVPALYFQPLTLPPAAPLTQGATEPLASPVEALPKQGLRDWRRNAGSAALLAIVLIATLGIFHTRPTSAAANAVRLGIVPFHAVGDPQINDAGEGFRLMLSDSISKLPHVQVRAASSFMTSEAADIPRLSHALNLDDLLLGSIARQGDQYDLKFELVRAADATHLASFEYSGARKDFPALCERLQQDVFHYLQAKTETLQTVKGSTNDPQAYELYLQGAFHMFEREPPSLRTAVAEFQQATVRDPRFAAAYAGMATAYLKLSAYDTNPQDGLLRKAEHFAQNAIQLDPSLAQAHAVLGCTAYKLDRDFSRGEAELRNAIRIDSTQAEYRNWLAVLLTEEGRFDEALEQLNLAHTSAPFWPSVYAMEGLVGVYARRNKTALGAASRYAELLPGLPIAHNTLAWVYFETGHYQEAVDEWRRMALLQNDRARMELEEKGMNLLKTKGIHAYAELRLAAIENKQGVGQVNDFSPAEWYACAGRHDQAIAELERLTYAHDPYMLHVGVDPLFDSFHKDSSFLALLARSGVTIPASLANVDSHICELSNKTH